MAGFPRFSGGSQGLTAVQQYKIAWADIDAFYLELFPAAVGGFPSLPAKLSGSTTLFADSVEFVPLVGEDDNPGGGSSQSYTYAKATVNFKQIPYEQAQASDSAADGQIITRKWNVSGEMLTLPSSALQWADNANAAVPEEVNGALIVPSLDIVVTLHRVTSTYFATLLGNVFDQIGTINNAIFEDAPAYTLLLLGGDFEQVVSANEVSYQCELKFSYKGRETEVPGDAQQQGWNIFLDPANGKWHYLKKKDGNDIYKSSTFTDLYD